MRIDNLTLFSFFFLDGYKFTTCGKSGPLGPEQSECDAAYGNGTTRVLIGDEKKGLKEHHNMGHVTGIQRWTVPKTDIYT